MRDLDLLTMLIQELYLPCGQYADHVYLSWKVHLLVV